MRNINETTSSVPIPSTEGRILSDIQNMKSERSIFRVILDAICEFFTFKTTATTQEQKQIFEEIKNAIIQSDDDVGEYGTAPERLSITVRDVSVELYHENDAIYAKTPGEISRKIIGSEGKTISHMIADTLLGKCDINPELKEQMTPIACSALLTTVLKGQGYEPVSLVPGENEVSIEEDNETFILPHDKEWRTDTAKIIMPYEISGIDGVEFSNLETELNNLRDDEVDNAQKENREPLPVVTILSLKDAPGILNMKTNHFVACIVSPSNDTLPVIIDSKTSISVYPKSVTVLRSHHQSLIDDKSCGAHSCRAVMSAILQLDAGLTVSQIKVCEKWDEDISASFDNKTIDAESIRCEVKALYQGQIETMDTKDIDEDAIMSFDDNEEMNVDDESVIDDTNIAYETHRMTSGVDGKHKKSWGNDVTR